MIYVMGLEMYKEYTAGKNALKHNELIEHVNQSFGLRGTVTTIQVGESQ